MLKSTSIIATLLLITAFSNTATARWYQGNVIPGWKEAKASEKIDNPYTTDGPREKCKKMHEGKRSNSDIRFCNGAPGGNNFDFMNN